MAKAKAKKAKTAKARPPRLYYDKKQDRYFIRVGGKKVYFPKGSEPKKIMQKLLRKVRTTAPGRKRKARVNKKGEKETGLPKGFLSSGAPLVSYSSLDPNVQKILQKQAENIAEQEKRAAAEAATVKANAEGDRKVATLTTQLLAITDGKENKQGVVAGMSREDRARAYTAAREGARRSAAQADAAAADPRGPDPEGEAMKLAEADTRVRLVGRDIQLAEIERQRKETAKKAAATRAAKGPTKKQYKKAQQIIQEEEGKKGKGGGNTEKFNKAFELIELYERIQDQKEIADAQAQAAEDAAAAAAEAADQDAKDAERKALPTPMRRAMLPAPRVAGKPQFVRDPATGLPRQMQLGDLTALATQPPVGPQRQLFATERKLTEPTAEDLAAMDADANIPLPEPSQMGEGKLADQTYDVGVYSDQILKMMKNYVKDGFLGVVAADEVHLLAQKSLPFDKFGFIMNKDPSTKPGSHWTAVYVDTVDDKEIDYFDSFAEEPDELLLSELKKMLQAHKLDIYLKFKVNRVKHQAENSNLCGFHAMKFLMDRFAGKPFIDASGWSAVRKGEAEAKNLMQKFDRFGYI